MKRPIILNLSPEEISALAEVYKTTHDVRIRTRVQICLLSGEQGWTAQQIARVVRLNEDSVVLWLKRYQQEGIPGLADRPRSGAPSQLLGGFAARLEVVVRQRPRSLGLPFSLWSLQRLADYLASETGKAVSSETIRRLLLKQAIVFSRPQHHVSSPDPDYAVKKRPLKASAIASHTGKFSTTPTKAP